MYSRIAQGDQICFDYNLGTCKQGSACARKHVCAVPGCYKNHPQMEHQRPQEPSVHSMLENG